MLRFLIISLLGCDIVHPAAATLPLHVTHAARLSPPPPNISTTVNSLPSLDSSLPNNFIDPRFTTDTTFVDPILDKRSAYMNTVLALAGLSTKGWTRTLSFEAEYRVSRYGDVIIRIYASKKPSSLQFRHAIWGLYLAIHKISANDFHGCLLGLYWTPIEGGARHLLGYVSIIAKSSLGIGGNNSTEGSLKLAPSMQVSPRKLVLSNLTTTPSNSAPFIDQEKDFTNLKVVFSLHGRPLDVDAVFHTVYKGLVYQSSYPQRDPIDKPGEIEDPVTSTFLLWDATHLTSFPFFEYRYGIAALARLPAYMYDMNRFEETRYIVYVDDQEVGRGWITRRSTEGVRRLR